MKNEVTLHIGVKQKYIKSSSLTCLWRSIAGENEFDNCFLPVLLVINKYLGIARYDFT